MYDISECGLKNVPSGVYSKCKVLRKEALLLQVVLNKSPASVSHYFFLKKKYLSFPEKRAYTAGRRWLSGRHGRRLAGERIFFKKNFLVFLIFLLCQVLDLHGNNLDKLPEEIGMLKNLRVRREHTVSHTQEKKKRNSFPLGYQWRLSPPPFLSPPCVCVMTPFLYLSRIRGVEMGERGVLKR